MHYVAENKRKTLAALLAAALTLTLGFAAGRLSHDPSTPDLTPRLTALQHQLGQQQTSSRILAAQLATATRTTVQLRSTITSQQAQITQLKRRRRKPKQP